MDHLSVISSYRDKMYCDCQLDALDQYQTNERGILADSPLTRAVEHWISERVAEFCRELEQLDRRKMSQQEKNKASRINEFLDAWKNQFLRDMMHGLYGEGVGATGTDTNALPSGTPVRLEVSLSHAKAGLGVYFKPALKFFDEAGRRIRPVPFQWGSEDNNIAMVDADLNFISTFAYGTTEIYAETLEEGLRSNLAPVEVVRLLNIRVAPQAIELPAGTRGRLEAICELPNGEETTDVYLMWLDDNESIARVSASGLVYAFAQGETEVTAADDKCSSVAPCRITVTPGEDAGPGDRRGRGFPKILLSEIDYGPGEDRARQFRRDEPPVTQHPQDVSNNVWWINMASPFARLYYDGGRKFGADSQAWRMYHVERIIDVMIQIALRHGPDSEEEAHANDWIFRASVVDAEIREKAAESLADFIENGDLTVTA